mmetsp:Transcript_13618/g.28960  ORF Transcript_13618/g.28960 Transcript_13618/m.28960 type:complete len:505 (-) Transcript_13618:23-1537(-)
MADGTDSNDQRPAHPASRRVDLQKMKPLIVLLAALVAANHGVEVSAFVGHRSVAVERIGGIRIQTTHLNAKGAGGNKKKKQKKKKAPGGSSGGVGGAGGGFGKKTAAVIEAIDVDDDYSAFPPLEPSVKETLVPATPEIRDDAGELDAEIYARLGQIYGFEWFNYAEDEDPSVAEDDSADEGSNSKEDAMAAPSLSFDEILSGGSDASSSSSSPGFGDLLGASKASASSDFADMIAEASGGSTSTTATKPKADPTAPVGKVDLAKLKPFNRFRVLNVDPMVLAIDEFFSEEECNSYIERALKPDLSEGNAPTVEIQSKTVGKNARDRAQRTSTTWFNHYKSVPELMSKASRLLGLTGVDRWEEPQIVRYRKGEKFTWHLDALAPDGELASLGGQRIATLLVYLTELSEGQGGATMFRDLGGDDGPLKVIPRKGSALLFFPAAGGIPNVPFDIRTLHCGEAVAEDSPTDKWIAQLWLRETSYKPTAPPDNTHAAAVEAINKYCNA